MKIEPFRALRPRAGLADKIASPPYDVVSTDEARALAADDPYSFLHVVKPEIDLDPGVDPYDPGVYARGHENFKGFVERGWLVRDEVPAYTIYRLRMGNHVQTGVVAASSADDYREGRIKRHEFTRPVKEDDRVRLVTALGAHPGPVFLAYRDRTSLTEAVDRLATGEPDVDFVAADGVQHSLWRIDAAEAVERLRGELSALPATYIADGHHRAAASARVGSETFLSVLFPHSQLHVLDYNRVVRDLNGLDAGGFLSRLREAGFELVSDWAARTPPERRNFGVYLDGRWSLMRPGASMSLPDEPPQGLDVAILSDRVLAPILDIGDPRTDSRIDFVGGIRGMDELERRVDSGTAAVAFAMWPTSMAEVMDVADRGEVMPPKSTWFEPKLRSGLVVQTF